MNPQPPVTRIRTASPSSGDESALADFRRRARRHVFHFTQSPQRVRRISKSQEDKQTSNVQTFNAQLGKLSRGISQAPGGQLTPRLNGGHLKRLVSQGYSI